MLNDISPDFRHKLCTYMILDLTIKHFDFVNNLNKFWSEFGCSCPFNYEVKNEEHLCGCFIAKEPMKNNPCYFESSLDEYRKEIPFRNDKPRKRLRVANEKRWFSNKKCS